MGQIRNCSYPAQDRLWEKKAYIWLLRLYGKKVSTIARLAGVSRNSLYRFLRSERYKIFRVYLEGEPLLKEVLREWNEIPVDDVQRVNEMSVEEIRKQIKVKLPHLF